MIAVPTLTELRAELRAATARVTNDLPWPEQVRLARIADGIARKVLAAAKAEAEICATAARVLP